HDVEGRVVEALEEARAELPLRQRDEGLELADAGIAHGVTLAPRAKAVRRAITKSHEVLGGGVCGSDQRAAGIERDPRAPNPRTNDVGVHAAFRLLTASVDPRGARWQRSVVAAESRARVAKLRHGIAAAEVAAAGRGTR